ncbi:MAG: thioredoxin family protein [Pyrinomonadaceae bacterium]|nr:thioredoxin family protein [Pyrinomonadaceae bacterium]
MQFRILFFGLCLMLAATAWQAIGVASNRTSNLQTKDSGTAVGGAVADFKLPDVAGKEHTLAALRGQKGTVLIFVSVQCPVSNGYNKRMEKLAQEYKARGVNVVGINANDGETPEMVGEHATGAGLTFPILKDKGNKVADQLGALVTPEAFFLDADNKLVYRGRIDNSRDESEVATNDLREVVDATLAGKPAVKTEARAFGCTIRRVS